MNLGLDFYYRVGFYSVEGGYNKLKGNNNNVWWKQKQQQYHLNLLEHRIVIVNKLYFFDSLQCKLCSFGR